MGDFARALDVLSRYDFDAVELSALRISEVEPLINALPNLNLSRYKYVSSTPQVPLARRKKST